MTTYQPGSEGHDTSVFSAAPAQISGDLDYIEVGRVSGVEARAFLRFDVPVRPGYDILAATLEIYVYSKNDPASVLVPSVECHRIGTAWEEDRTTWNDQPPVTGAALSSADITAVGRWVFPVGAAVVEWQAGGVNNGFRLAFPPGGDARSFRAYSSDYTTDPDLRPRLVVTYGVKPPNAPIIDQGAFPANESQVLSWRFSHDDPNSPQTAYEVEIYRVSDGVVVLDTTKVASSSTQMTLAAGTLVNGVDYQWRVKTWGFGDGEGPFSGFDLFRTEARPSVAITAPAANTVVTTSSTNVTWTYSSGTAPNFTDGSAQARYRVRLYATGTNTLAYDSGEVVGSNTSHTVPDLQDVTSYRVEVTTTSQNGVNNNPPAQVNFSVDTVPPPTPQVAALGDTEGGRVLLTITNPGAGTGEVATASNRIYRRLTGTTIWTLVGTVGVNGTFSDYTIGGGVSVDYRVEAVSTANTTASVTTTVVLTLYGVWLHEPSNPAGTLGHFFYDGMNRDETYAPEVELMRFAGRGGAVAEFGPQSSIDQVEASVQLASGDTDRERLRALARRRVVVCYRDGQQRKVYGVITNLQIRDEKWGGSATFRLEIVDFVEVA